MPIVRRCLGPAVAAVILGTLVLIYANPDRQVLWSVSMITVVYRGIVAAGRRPGRGGALLPAQPQAQDQRRTRPDPAGPARAHDRVGYGDWTKRTSCRWSSSGRASRWSPPSCPATGRRRRTRPIRQGPGVTSVQRLSDVVPGHPRHQRRHGRLRARLRQARRDGARPRRDPRQRAGRLHDRHPHRRERGADRRAGCSSCRTRTGRR